MPEVREVPVAGSPGGRPAEEAPGDGVRPRLRGVSHAIALAVALPLGAALGFAAETTRGRVSAIVFAVSVVAMLGASALYHRVTWSPRWRPWLRRLDHAGIYALIAGTYTPFGLLVLSGNWSVVVLAVVWTGAVAGVALRFLWVDAPTWLSAVIGVALGWVGVVAFPQILDRIGLAAALLVLAGGVAYTVGAVIYALRRPDPVPAVFGYHELFHAFVLAAVACHYAAVAFYVLPEY